MDANTVKRPRPSRFVGWDEAARLLGFTGTWSFKKKVVAKGLLQKHPSRAHLKGHHPVFLRADIERLRKTRGYFAWPTGRLM